jgi:hypothetical protein
MITLEEVRVYIQRDANTTVSELLLNIFRVGLLLNQETGEGVPEVMEPDLAQIGSCEGGSKSSTHQLIAHTLPGRA